MVQCTAILCLPCSVAARCMILMWIFVCVIQNCIPLLHKLHSNQNRIEYRCRCWYFISVDRITVIIIHTYTNITYCNAKPLFVRNIFQIAYFLGRAIIPAPTVEPFIQVQNERRKKIVWREIVWIIPLLILHSLMIIIMLISVNR